MKKEITLVMASIFLAGSMAYASENPVFSDNQGKATVRHHVDYRDAEPIKFMERGIEFYVFPNGDFDFNTRPQDSDTDDGYYFKAAGKRGTVTVERHPVNYGVRIERDAFGRVRRVGNTFINYDAFDRVNRIGTVYMKYNSFALTQIGGLRIVYDRKRCIINMYGNVKGRSYGYDYPRGYESPRNDYPRNDYPRGGGYENDDDDYYYYKADGTKAKIEDSSDNKEDESVRNKR
ncbi:hypothetical protein NAT51_17245 [Flavobacterium amniphilum]|uniref:hypothetical protein n=1 Tax=Flavobacterium amniphilum TaxID=1834035 RepID=UPI00202A44A5|nr:hypothetical protein [Flavobacterium amniphilum]MCL9807280.1 hypothetical protein [Flavobacterium amniphilum]